MEDNFLDSEYKEPKEQSNYFKYQEGVNRVRILSSAVTGYEYFNTSNKPVRSKEAPEELPKDIKQNGKVKHFWAFVIWNYDLKKIQIMEITQKSIMKDVRNLINNPKWGNPKLYDLAITKTGEGLDTEYSTIGEPPVGEVPEEILAEYEKVRVDLSKLFTNDNPFE